MRSSTVVRLLALAAVTLGCRQPSTGDQAPRPSASQVEAAAPDAGARLEPLGGEWMTKLDLPGGGVAYVAPPLGSTEPRPVVVAVHGAMDHPSLMCSAWRVVADVYPFVVCPAGAKVGERFVWSSSDMIDQAIDAALAAAKARFGPRMVDGPMVYAAFSQSATLAGPVLTTANRGRFTRAALTEGGYHALDDASARAFAKAGGQRVLYTCSQGGCVPSFGASKSALAGAGVGVKVESPGPHGHSMVPAVRASLQASLGWLTDGVAGWEGYASAPKLEAH